MIVTLTTDFGNSHYVASLKGSILYNNTDINIVDITHNIAPFSKMETAYIIKNCYTDFPKGTIHIIGVKSEFHKNNRPLIVEYNGYFFICADNGILSLILEDEF